MPSPTTVAVCPAISTDGTTRFSLAVIDTVIVSPPFARPVSAALLDTMVTAVSVGASKSIVTTLVSITAEISTPALLARSSNTTSRLA